MRNLYFKLIVFISMFFVSCQEEETQSVGSTVSQEEAAIVWQATKAKEVFESVNNAYIINNGVFERALMLSKVKSVRFILEVHNNLLHIRVVGADQIGNTTRGILLSPTINIDGVNRLLNRSQNKGGKGGESFFEQTNSEISHILEPDDAVDYIQRWREAFNSEELEEMISYEGVRIKYFSMPVSVIEQMMAENKDGVQLVWGINSQGKLTTVFLPHLVPEMNGSSNKNEGNIYDFTAPCPSTCD